MSRATLARTFYRPLVCYNYSMPDDASTPPPDVQTPPPQSGNTATGQAPKSEDTSGQATPPPEAAASAPEPEQVSEDLTGKPNTPTTPSVGTDTPPRPTEQSFGRAQAGGEETPAPTEAPSSVQGSSGTQQATQADITPSQSPPSKGGEERRGDLALANAKIQEAKRKKLDKIMARLSEKVRITNDEVEKLLRVSDATATRYLQALEKENKIKQTGSTGTGVFYEKL